MFFLLEFTVNLYLVPLMSYGSAKISNTIRISDFQVSVASHLKGVAPVISNWDGLQSPSQLL